MDILEQDHAYKRGLVLGLTLAEIVILILFCLLMALTAIFVRQRDEISRHEATIQLQAARIAELEASVAVDPADLLVVATLKEYWERHAPPELGFREYFSELVLRVEELDRLRARLEELVERSRDLVDRLAEAQARAPEAETLAQTQALADSLEALGIDVSSSEGRERLQAALGALDALEASGGDADGLVATLVSLQSEVGDLRQLIGYYERRFGYPPCWHDGAWNTDYTFDVKLTTDGYVLRGIEQPRHADHPVMPAVQAVTTGREISPQQFVIQTRPLFRWSLENQCRFFVTVYDGTAEEEKRIFQQRMRTLEGHFYKRERLNVPPPF